MLFSSLEFIFLFLPVCAAIYFLVPLRAKNAVLLIFSLAFYGFGEPIYVFLMIFTVTADYIFGALVQRNLYRKRRAKAVLIISIIFNLGILAYFKYYSFFTEIFSATLGISLPLGAVPDLPIGISFYTFQAMSYVIDVYRGDAKAQRDPLILGTYVALFPQLIAGPIIRYGEIADQLNQREHSLVRATSGIRRFCVGLAKKCILANAAGELWSDFCGSFATGVHTSTLGAWMALIAFSFQIYFDFSGYSDMAIGLGRIFGFEFPENFNYPYTAKSITDFWRRWHITLSTWFREYVYIPLGGNRCTRARMYLNLLIVWSLTGIWHGAALNFLLWGLYYFLLLSIEKAFLLKALKKLPPLLSHLYSLTFIALGWLIFAADGGLLGVKGAVSLLGAMLGVRGTPLTTSGAIYDALRLLPFFLIMAIAATPIFKKLTDHASQKFPNTASATQSALALLSLVISTAYLVNSGYNPFLYFRF